MFSLNVFELRKLRTVKAKPNDSLLKEGQVVLFRPISMGFRKKAFGSENKWRVARICKLHPSKKRRSSQVS